MPVQFGTSNKYIPADTAKVTSVKFSGGNPPPVQQPYLGDDVSVPGGSGELINGWGNVGPATTQVKPLYYKKDGVLTSGYTLNEILESKANAWRPGYNYSQYKYAGNPYSTEGKGYYADGSPVISGYYYHNGKYFPIDQSQVNKSPWGNSGYNPYSGGGAFGDLWRPYFGQVMWDI